MNTNEQRIDPRYLPRRPISTPRFLGRLLILVLPFLFLCEFYGVPSVLTTYRYRGEKPDHWFYIDGDYLSIFGDSHFISASPYGGDLPLIIFIPLEKSLVVHAKENLLLLWNSSVEQHQKSGNGKE